MVDTAPAADPVAPPAAPEAPASPSETFGAELTDFLKSDLEQTARGEAPAGDPPDAAGTPEGTDRAPAAPAPDASASSATADTTAAAEGQDAPAGQEGAPAPDWHAIIGAVPRDELLKHPQIAGLVGDVADKRAKALERQRAAERVTEEMPAFVQDWQALDPEQRTAWLEGQAEFKELVDAARNEAMRAIAVDFASLIELDLDAIQAAGDDRAKQREAVLQSKAVREAIEAEAARREKIAHEAGTRSARSGSRAEGILPTSTDNARPPVSTPATFQEGQEAFREGLSALLAAS